MNKLMKNYWNILCITTSKTCNEYLISDIILFTLFIFIVKTRTHLSICVRRTWVTYELAWAFGWISFVRVYKVFKYNIYPFSICSYFSCFAIIHISANNRPHGSSNVRSVPLRMTKKPTVSVRPRPNRRTRCRTNSNAHAHRPHGRTIGRMRTYVRHG